MDEFADDDKVIVIHIFRVKVRVNPIYMYIYL